MNTNCFFLGSFISILLSSSKPYVNIFFFYTLFPRRSLILFLQYHKISSQFKWQHKSLHFGVMSYIWLDLSSILPVSIALKSGTATHHHSISQVIRSFCGYGLGLQLSTEAAFYFLQLQYGSYIPGTLHLNPVITLSFKPNPPFVPDWRLFSVLLYNALIQLVRPYVHHSSDSVV